MKAGLNHRPMVFGYHAPWENYPKNLLFEEVQYPYLVFTDFFYDDPLTHRKLLTEWKAMIKDERAYTGGKRGPVELVVSHDEWIRAIEACYALYVRHRIKVENPAYNLTTPELLRWGKQHWTYYPDDLSEEEQLNPFRAIKAVFKYKSLQEYREYLKEWLYPALRNEASSYDRITSRINKIYANLCKLHSAAWLLKQIELRFQQERAGTIERVGGKTQTELNQKEPWPEAEQRNQQEESNPTAQSINFKPIDPKLSESENAQMDTFINSIIQVIPEIITIISLGRSDEPYVYYWLLLIRDNAKVTPDEITDTISNCYDNSLNLYPIVYNLRSAINGLNDRGRFWTIVFGKGILLYQHPDNVFPMPQPLSAETHSIAITAAWKRWGMPAKHYLQQAKRYQNKHDDRTAFFFLHQGMEYILRGFLQMAFGYRQPVTDVSRLLKLIRLFPCDFTETIYSARNSSWLIDSMFDKFTGNKEITISKEDMKEAVLLVGQLIILSEAYHKEQARKAATYFL